MSAAEVLKIDLEGHGGPWDKPRDRRRVIVEVDIEPASGTCIAGRKVRQGLNRLEMYVDRLDEITGRMQTAAHRAALEQAREIAKMKQEEWARDALKGVTGEERQKRFDQECPFNEYTEVVLFPATRTGVPPVKSMRYVKADGSTVESFDKLSDDDFLDAPLTPDNAPIRAADAQTRALERLIERLDGRNRGGNGKR